MPEAALALRVHETPAGPYDKVAGHPEGWLASADAAAALGIAERTAQRRCRTGSLAAAMVAGEWFVDPACDPALRLAAGFAPGPVALGSEFAALTEAQRRRAYGRLEILRRFAAAREHKPHSMSGDEFACRFAETANATRDTGAGAPNVSRSSLLRWVASFQRRGVAGLIDRRGGARTEAPFSPEAKEFIKGLYAREGCPSIPYVYRIAAGEARVQGWQLPPLRTVQRWLRTKADPKLLASARTPKLFRDRLVPYIERDWSLVFAMEAWVADHRVLDVWVPRRVVETVNGRRAETISWQRPWLTMFLDCRSWMPVGWVLAFDAPNAQRVASCFVEAVEQHGCPRHVIIDNGKDFRSAEFGGQPRKRAGGEKLFDEKHYTPLLEALGVQAHWAIPKNARAKVVEPWFGVMASRFDRAWPTYLGHSTEHKPEQVKPLAARAADCIDKLNLQVISDALDAWILDDYALAPSPAVAAAGRSALRAFRELRRSDGQPVRPSIETLALLLTRSRRAPIEANGVWVRAFMNHYWSESPEFERRRAASGRDVDRHVCVRYVDGDPSRVWVFDARRENFLFMATPYQGSGLHPLAEPGSADAEKLAGAIALQRRIARDYTQAAREARRAAHNVLLEAHRRGGSALGILDDPKSILAPPAPVVRLVGEADRAAQAGREHKQQEQKRFSAREWLLGGTSKQATGTDDDAGRQTRASSGNRQAGPLADLAERQEKESEDDREQPGAPAESGG